MRKSIIVISSVLVVIVLIVILIYSFKNGNSYDDYVTNSGTDIVDDNYVNALENKPDVNIEEVIYEMCKDYGEGELSYCAIDPQYDNTLPSKGIYNEYIYFVPETELYYRFYVEDGIPVLYAVCDKFDNYTYRKE